MTALSTGTPPWYFQIATKLLGSKVRGGYRYLKLLGRMGWLNRSATFVLPDGSTLTAPLTWPGIAHADIFETYEPDAIKMMGQAIDKAKTPICFIDCGADIGVYSRLLMTHTGKIKTIVAIEPNASAIPFLESNLSDAESACRVIHGAISNFSGFGKLIAPAGTVSSHALFLKASSEPTELNVHRIDDLEIERPATIAMKIDVEGEELKVLEGALETLRTAEHFILQVEAHPEVCQRVGLEPMELIHFLKKIKPCEVWACIEKTRQVFEVKDMDTPFFDQFDKDEIHDLIFISATD